MKYPRLMARLFNTPLMVRPSYARTVAHVLSPRMGDYEVESDGDLEIVARKARGASVDDDGIATVPVLGGLYHRGDELDAMSGAESYTNLRNTLVGMCADTKVRGIILDIDSPGGEAGGCFSFAQDLAVLSAKKPIWGFANTDAASAAYAIGCSCSKLYAPMDARVGSIGVVVLHMDYSQHMKEQGVVATHVFAGKHKVDGSPFMPLEGEALAEIQKSVNDRYEQFVSLVATKRGLDESLVRATEAREYLANEAESMGLIDAVMSFEEVRQEMLSELKTPVTQVRVVNGKPITWIK